MKSLILTVVGIFITASEAQTNSCPPAIKNINVLCPNGKTNTLPCSLNGPKCDFDLCCLKSIEGFPQASLGNGWCGPCPDPPVAPPPSTPKPTPPPSVPKPAVHLGKIGDSCSKTSICGKDLCCVKSTVKGHSVSKCQKCAQPHKTKAK